MSGGETIVWLVQIWLTAGAVVAALFLIVGIDRIDGNKHTASEGPNTHIAHYLLYMSTLIL